jgi:TRAP-type mannitol/chloroaromatic compound transport system substrate-binding protein
MPSRRDFLKVGAFAVAGSVAAPFVVSPARAQAINLKIQGFLPAASPTHKALEKFGADIGSKSGGRLAIQTLPGGAAVGVTESLNAVQAGILDGHYTAASYFAAKDPAFIVFGDTGASYNDVETRDRWYAEGGGAELGAELYGKYGMVYVGNVFWPSEQIPTRKPLRSFSDLNGLKIRVPPGMIAEILSASGAAVVNLPGGEVFNALQSGVIDATDWASPSQNYDVGLYKAAKFSVYAAHSMAGTEVCIAKRAWDRIPADLQAMIREEVKAMSANLKATLKEQDAAAVAKYKAEGVEEIIWSAAEIGKLRENSSKIQDQIGAKSDLAKKIVDSHRTFQKKIA